MPTYEFVFNIVAEGDDEEAAWDEAQDRMPFLLRDAQEVNELSDQPPTSSVTDPKPTVLVTGTPADGFTFYGPVTPNDSTLDQFIDRNLHDTYWWYCELLPLPTDNA